MSLPGGNCTSEYMQHILLLTSQMPRSSQQHTLPVAKQRGEMSPVHDCSAHIQARQGYMFCFSAASSSLDGMLSRAPWGLWSTGTVPEASLK